MPLPFPPLGPRPFLDEKRRVLEKARYQGFDVRAMSPVIGAEVHGLDLGSLTDESFAEVERALLDFKVLVFRDQAIGAEAQIAFAERFGEVDDHPFLPAAEGQPKVDRFAKDADTVGVENIWHTDVTWKELPPLGTVLRAIEVPEVGGDTLFADMASAYRGLAKDVRERVASMRAVHDFTNSFGRLLDPETRAERQKQFPPVEHPVVRSHPRTGEPILFVNRIFTSHLVGLAPDESDELLAHLCEQATFPEYQCRVRWAPGTVTMWDNRAVQHYAANDYWPRKRVMERVTIVGDRPQGIAA